MLQDCILKGKNGTFQKKWKARYLWKPSPFYCYPLFRKCLVAFANDFSILLSQIISEVDLSYTMFLKKYWRIEKNFTQPFHHLIVKVQSIISFQRIRCLKHIRSCFNEISKEKVCFTSCQKNFSIFVVYFSLLVCMKSIFKSSILEQ